LRAFIHLLRIILESATVLVCWWVAAFSTSRTADAIIVITENDASNIMRTCIVQTRKAGDNLIITLPKEVIEAEQLKPDIFIKITVEKVKGQNITSQQNDTSLGPEDPWRLLE
jgi:hypothetical protein